MKFWAGLMPRVLLPFLAAFLMSGCNRSGLGPLDEEKEPHFLAGKERISTLDWNGAIESFEKALQVNPRSAAAHFELGWIYDQKEVDPAAAIYHYDHFLRLRPQAENAELATNRIIACKQALAQTVSLGPVTEKVQRQLEQYAEENKRLIDENKRLQEELAKWSAYAARLQTLTNPPAVSSAPVRTSQTTAAVHSTNPGPSRSGGAESPVAYASVPPAAARTHTVKAGETPSLIARKYAVKLDALMAANPSLDARRLRVGQVLKIPGS